MKGKWALLGAAAVLSGIAAGAFFRFRTPPPAPAAAGKSAATPGPGTLTLIGKIRAAHVVSVRAGIQGNLEAFEAEVGSEVYAGQELARVGGAALDAEQAEASEALEKAQARVEGAEKNVAAAQLEASRAHADAQRARAGLDRLQKIYDRQKVLVAAGATPRLTFEKTEREYEGGRQEWEAVDRAARAADERIRDTMKELDGAKKIATGRQEQLLAAQSAAESGVVLAPVDGVIVGRGGEVGQPAEQPGDGLFQIGTDLYDLEVALEPKPELLRQIKVGQPALVIIPDLQGTSATGAVKEVTGIAAVVSFTSQTPTIRPGMVAEVRLQSQ